MQEGYQLGRESEIVNTLSQAELSLKMVLREYQNLHNQLAVRAKICYDNNQSVLSIFVRIASVSFKPIEAVLRFLDDSDLMSVAASCQTLYKLIYSPLGYRIMHSLRPVVVKIKREGAMPYFNRQFLENLCNQISMANMDEDDKIAIIQTMKTNLMAARQKMREIELCNDEWERRKVQIRKQTAQIGRQRDQQRKEIDKILEQKEKLFEMLKEGSNNIARLKQSQERLLQQRQNRKKELQVQKTKLLRQKDLLIKKIKAQQKQREEGLIYAREVTRITTMLNKLTTKK